MATIKSFTDLEQSKKLAEILPIESADMYYSDVPVREWVDKTDISKGTHVIFKSQIFAIENLRNHKIGEGEIYAWSLAALMDMLPIGTESHKQSDGSISYYYVEVYNNKKYFSTERYDNPIDACYKLILKLNELKML